MNKRIFAALATVVLGFGVIAGIGTYVAAAKNDPGVTVAESADKYIAPDGTEYPQVKLSLNVYPNSLFGGHHGAGGGAHPDYVSYGLGGPNGEVLSDAQTGTNFQVPAHTAVTITVYQYDSGETLNNDYFAHVRGTVDGKATFVQRWDTKAKSNASTEQQITNIPADMVGHTFTIHGISDKKSQLFVSVPLMMSNDEEVTAAEEEGGFTRFPTKTTFTFITGDEGEYIWNCEFPCGDGTIARFGNAMSSMGYMSGHFTVKG
jgi:hypothetical protein